MFMELPAGTAIWLGIAILLGIFEIFSAGFFFIFFAAGALITAVISLWLPSALAQTVIFVLVSLGLVWFARPLLKQTLQISDQPKYASNVSALIGAEVMVLETVSRHQGKVKVTGTGEVWSAYLSEDVSAETLPEGQTATTLKVDGAKLVIQPKPST